MSGQANPINVEQYLQQHQKFPAGKGELVDQAHKEHAPAHIPVALEQLPEQRYDKASDAARSVPADTPQFGADSPDDL